MITFGDNKFFIYADLVADRVDSYEYIAYNKEGKIILSFGDKKDIEVLRNKYEEIEFEHSVWKALGTFCREYFNYIHTMNCISCKIEKKTKTEKKIKLLFRMEE